MKKQRRGKKGRERETKDFQGHSDLQREGDVLSTL
jgi:hypothetical protein